MSNLLIQLLGTGVCQGHVRSSKRPRLPFSPLQHFLLCAPPSVLSLPPFGVSRLSETFGLWGCHNGGAPDLVHWPSECGKCCRDCRDRRRAAAALVKLYCQWQQTIPRHTHERPTHTGTKTVIRMYTRTNAHQSSEAHLKGDCGAVTSCCHHQNNQCLSYVIQIRAVLRHSSSEKQKHHILSI